MTNEEMQKAMEFIVEMDRRAAITLDRLSKKQKQSSERKWKRTEVRLHALLSHARKQERKRKLERKLSAPPSKHESSLKGEAPNQTETDKRLQALAELVERQIKERRVENS
jgi:hypothetical protein